MWDLLIQQSSLKEILNDSGLAQIGDNLLNLCFSLAKSAVAGRALGEKVSDTVLAKSIRGSSVYHCIGRRSDTGRAGDAYEALAAYLWLSRRTSTDQIVAVLSQNLETVPQSSRRRQQEAAVHAFRQLLVFLIDALPAHMKNTSSTTCDSAVTENL
ncbi:MAG: hypothetical protein HXY34_01945 [Candidatus Thorarchaeota archaeon]|nr:hypothetical protein [Candidatus Thorarchaeota archaeon]